MNTKKLISIIVVAAIFAEILIFSGCETRAAAK